MLQGYKTKAKECNGYGTYKCGICECDESHFGRQCECDSDNTHGSKDLTAGCRPDNFTQADCSNRGSCVCGQCECESRDNPEEVSQLLYLLLL
jgi:protocadherin alpha